MKRSGRREFLLGGAAWLSRPSRILVVNVRLLFDQGAHGGQGLNNRERARFHDRQEAAGREFAVSGIRFVYESVDGAFVRTQGYSEIPDRFLARGRINLFVTETLGYDIDRDRTGGCSMGPRGRGNPFYQTFLGLREAGENTLPHEFAHHLSLDTKKRPSAAGNFWADLRNDYWLRLQRHDVPIWQFRDCLSEEWIAK